MKSSTEFESFYQSHLKSNVEQIENRRLVIAQKYSFKGYRKLLLRFALALPVIFIGVSFVPSIDPDQLNFLIPTVAGYAMLAPIYILIRRNWVFRPLTKEYKQTVIPKLILFLGEQLKYTPEEGITLEEFNKSGLFEKPSGYTSEDLVAGQVGALYLKLADVTATKNTTNSVSKVGWNPSYGSRRKSSRSGSTVLEFGGLYGHVKLTSAFLSPIFIKPTYTGIAIADKFLTGLLKSSVVLWLKDQMNLKEVKTGNSEFDGFFSVRCDNANEVKKVLTPLFIQTLLAFKKQVEVPVHLALADNELHVGFAGVNLFEVNATSLTEKNITFTYFNYLNLAIGLAEAVEKLTGGPNNH